MKSKYIFIALGISLLVIVVILLNNDQTNTATSSNQINQDSLADIDLSFPEATEEIEGLIRLEVDDTELSGGDKKDIFKLEHTSQSEEKKGRFMFILRNFYDQDCMKEIQNVMLCIIAPVDEFNEFIVTTANQSQTLHRYQLTEGYSLLGFTGGMDVHSTIYFGYPEDNRILFTVTRYDEDIQKEHIYYVLDMETGIVTERNRDVSECRLTSDRKSCGFLHPLPSQL